jgi:hypothetical protein
MCTSILHFLIEPLRHAETQCCHRGHCSAGDSMRDVKLHQTPRAGLAPAITVSRASAARQWILVRSLSCIELVVVMRLLTKLVSLRQQRLTRGLQLLHQSRT